MKKGPSPAKPVMVLVGGVQYPEHLLAAAVACLSERGFDRTRMRDVAIRAKVSIGNLQHYFETRDELLHAAFAWNCNDLINRWRAGFMSWPDDPWKRLVALIEELTLSPDLHRHAVTWTEYCACAARYPELRGSVIEVNVTWRQLIVDAIEEATALGECEPKLPAADVAVIFNALIDGFEMSTAVDANLVSPERFRDLILEVATNLLRPRPRPDASETAARPIHLDQGLFEKATIITLQNKGVPDDTSY